MIFSYIQNDLLPASERLPPQTRKKPSGPYNREHLLEYLKKEAKVILVSLLSFLPLIYTV